jgi:cysteine desulfurase
MTMYQLGRKNPSRRKIITSAIEHPCVMNAAAYLAEEGFPVVYLPVDSFGRIDLDALKKELGPDTLLVSIMAANNEIGTIEDIRTIAAMAKKAGAFVHSDATQAVGKVPVSVQEWGIDYLTLSCHKIYGPKEWAPLFVRPGAPIHPLIREGTRKTESGRELTTIWA